MADRIVGLR